MIIVPLVIFSCDVLFSPKKGLFYCSFLLKYVSLSLIEGLGFKMLTSNRRTWAPAYFRSQLNSATLAVMASPVI